MTTSAFATSRAASPRRRVLRLPGLALALSLVALADHAVLAQPHVAATFNAQVVNWSETATVREGGAAPTGTATFEHRFADERGRVFYELEAGDFTTPGAWAYAVQNAGVTYRFEPSATRKIYVGGSGWWRTNGESWASADYRGLGGFANLEFRPRATAVVRTGYRVDWRQFPDEPAMDQLQHTGFVSGLINLPSRTTMIGEVSVGAKRYGGGFSTRELFTPAAPSGQQGGSGGRGMGPALRPNASATSSVVEIRNPDAQSGQLTWFARVAQSLAARLALHVEASQRFTFGDIPPAVISTPEMYFDDGVYDDPYASDAFTWRVGLKQVFAGGAELTGGATHFSKDYVGTLALDPSGVALTPLALRSDEVWQADADLSWPLWQARTGAVDLRVLVGYLYTRSTSNDAFYTYRSHGATVGLAIAY